MLSGDAALMLLASLRRLLRSRVTSYGLRLPLWRPLVRCCGGSKSTCLILSQGKRLIPCRLAWLTLNRFLCVLPACCKVDLDKLRDQLGVKEVHLATEKEMAKIFPDCELGAEPPFGNMFDLETLMDKGLGEDGYIVCQAGTHEQAVRLDLEDYKKLTKPRILEFCYHLH